MHLLLVEDDRRLVTMLRYALEDEGYVVEAVYDGVSAESRVADPLFDVIILDVMLPDQDGVTLCRRLRQADIQTPVLMLTARDAVADRVRGLDAGADDYLVKPFAQAELIARLRVIVRRRQSAAEPWQLTAGPLVMNLQRREVTRDGRAIELSPREFSLLQYFMHNPGRVLSRAQIREAVWRQEGALASNVVEIYVHYLRDKIDKRFPQKLLQTIRGSGYVLRV